MKARHAAALLLAALLAGCSITRQPSAYGAIGADTATTAIGLARGATELNPLGLAVVPLSIALVEHAATLPPDEGVPIIHSVEAWKWGAAASNALMLLGAGPASFVVGGVVVWQLWQRGADEREYWAICRAFIDEAPQLPRRCLPFGQPYVSPVTQLESTGP